MNTTAYPLGQYEHSFPYYKQLHGQDFQFSIKRVTYLQKRFVFTSDKPFVERQHHHFARSTLNIKTHLRYSLIEALATGSNWRRRRWFRRFGLNYSFKERLLRRRCRRRRRCGDKRLKRLKTFPASHPMRPCYKTFFYVPIPASFSSLQIIIHPVYSGGIRTHGFHNPYKDQGVNCGFSGCVTVDKAVALDMASNSWKCVKVQKQVHSTQIQDESLIKLPNGSGIQVHLKSLTTCSIISITFEEKIKMSLIEKNSFVILNFLLALGR